MPSLAKSSYSPQELPEIKLFNKWSSDDVVVNDISLTDYVAVKEKFAKYLPHSAGRYAAKRFRKAQVRFKIHQYVFNRMGTMWAFKRKIISKRLYN